jgi:chorismate mutase
MELNEIQTKIDAIDSAIIHLLAQRSHLLSAAGTLKKDEHTVRDAKRVEEVIARVKTKAAEAGLAPEIAEEIYRTITGSFIENELSEFSQHGR